MKRHPRRISAATLTLFVSILAGCNTLESAAQKDAAGTHFKGTRPLAESSVAGPMGSESLPDAAGMATDLLAGPEAAPVPAISLEEAKRALETLKGIPLNQADQKTVDLLHQLRAMPVNDTASLNVARESLNELAIRMWNLRRELAVPSPNINLEADLSVTGQGEDVGALAVVLKQNLVDAAKSIIGLATKLFFEQKEAGQENRALVRIEAILTAKNILEKTNAYLASQGKEPVGQDAFTRVFRTDRGDIFQGLLSAMNDADPRVRAAAAYALFECRGYHPLLFKSKDERLEKQNRDTIERALGSPYWPLRYFAVQLLVKSEDGRARAVLSRYLLESQEKDPLVLMSVAQAVAEARTPGEAAAEFMEPMMRAWERMTEVCGTIDKETAYATREQQVLQQFIFKYFCVFGRSAPGAARVVEREIERQKGLGDQGQVYTLMALKQELAGATDGIEVSGRIDRLLFARGAETMAALNAAGELTRTPESVRGLFSFLAVLERPNEDRELVVTVARDLQAFGPALKLVSRPANDPVVERLIKLAFRYRDANIAAAINESLKHLADGQALSAMIDRAVNLTQVYADRDTDAREFDRFETDRSAIQGFLRVMGQEGASALTNRTGEVNDPTSWELFAMQQELGMGEASVAAMRQDVRLALFGTGNDAERLAAIRRLGEGASPSTAVETLLTLLDSSEQSLAELQNTTAEALSRIKLANLPEQSINHSPITRISSLAGRHPIQKVRETLSRSVSSFATDTASVLRLVDALPARQPLASRSDWTFFTQDMDRAVVALEQQGRGVMSEWVLRVRDEKNQDRINEVLLPAGQFLLGTENYRALLAELDNPITSARDLGGRYELKTVAPATRQGVYAAVAELSFETGTTGEALARRIQAAGVLGQAKMILGLPVLKLTVDRSTENLLVREAAAKALAEFDIPSVVKYTEGGYGNLMPILGKNARDINLSIAGRRYLIESLRNIGDAGAFNEVVELWFRLKEQYPLRNVAPEQLRDYSLLAGYATQALAAKPVAAGEYLKTRLEQETDLGRQKELVELRAYVAGSVAGQAGGDIWEWRQKLLGLEAGGADVAIQQLGAQQSPAAALVLVEALDRPDQRFQAGILEALAKYGGGMFTNFCEDPRLQKTLAIVRDRGLRHLRPEALRVLTRVDTNPPVNMALAAKGIGEVIGDLADVDQDHLIAAAKAAEKLPLYEVYAPLLERAQHFSYINVCFRTEDQKELIRATKEVLQALAKPVKGQRPNPGEDIYYDDLMSARQNARMNVNLCALWALADIHDAVYGRDWSASWEDWATLSYLTVPIFAYLVLVLALWGFLHWQHRRHRVVVLGAGLRHEGRTQKEERPGGSSPSDRTFPDDLTDPVSGAKQARPAVLEFRVVFSREKVEATLPAALTADEAGELNFILERFRHYLTLKEGECVEVPVQVAVKLTRQGYRPSQQINGTAPEAHYVIDPLNLKVTHGRPVIPRVYKDWVCEHEASHWRDLSRSEAWTTWNVSIPRLTSHHSQDADGDMRTAISRFLSANKDVVRIYDPWLMSLLKLDNERLNTEAAYDLCDTLEKLVGKVEAADAEHWMECVGQALTQTSAVVRTIPFYGHFTEAQKEDLLEIMKKTSDVWSGIARVIRVRLTRTGTPEVLNQPGAEALMKHFVRQWIQLQRHLYAYMELLDDSWTISGASRRNYDMHWLLRVACSFDGTMLDAIERTHKNIPILIGTGNLFCPGLYPFPEICEQVLRVATLDWAAETALGRMRGNMTSSWQERQRIRRRRSRHTSITLGFGLAARFVFDPVGLIAVILAPLATMWLHRSDLRVCIKRRETEFAQFRDRLAEAGGVFASEMRTILEGYNLYDAKMMQGEYLREWGRMLRREMDEPQVDATFIKLPDATQLALAVELFRPYLGKRPFIFLRDERPDASSGPLTVLAMLDPDRSAREFMLACLTEGAGYVIGTLVPEGYSADYLEKKTCADLKLNCCVTTCPNAEKTVFECHGLVLPGHGSLRLANVHSGYLRGLDALRRVQGGAFFSSIGNVWGIYPVYPAGTWTMNAVVTEIENAVQKLGFVTMAGQGRIMEKPTWWRLAEAYKKGDPFELANPFLRQMAVLSGDMLLVNKRNPQLYRALLDWIRDVYRFINDDGFRHPVRFVAVLLVPLQIIYAKEQEIGRSVVAHFDRSIPEDDPQREERLSFYMRLERVLKEAFTAHLKELPEAISVACVPPTLSTHSRYDENSHDEDRYIQELIAWADAGRCFL